ncbi:hypothetical protein VTK26DRAFT_3524 [Humicola hyalothermophila]
MKQPSVGSRALAVPLEILARDVADPPREPGRTGSCGHSWLCLTLLTLASLRHGGLAIWNDGSKWRDMFNHFLLGAGIFVVNAETDPEPPEVH